MAGSRVPGPSGMDAGSYERVCRVDDPVSPRATRDRVGEVNDHGLTDEEKELALDIAQITLDIIGIFEPTPFADGSNALISIGRGDWFGAVLSGISIIPYIGDLAKAGKLPGYSQKLYDAIQLARNKPEFAKLLQPALEKLKTVIDMIPTDLSPELADMVNKIKRPLDEYLGAAKLARKLTLTERLVVARLGSVHNVGELVWKNIDTAKDFFLRHGVPEDKMVDALNGMDVHSPIEMMRLNKGEKLSTSMVLPAGKKLDDLTEKELENLRPGEWFVKSGGGVGKESVGLAHGARQTVHFDVVQPVPTLKSKAASVDDFWTDGMQQRLGHAPLDRGPGTKRKAWTKLEWDPELGQLRVKAVDEETLKAAKAETVNLRGRDIGISTGVGTRGGGTQYYIPRNAQRAAGRTLKITTRAVKYGTPEQDDGEN